MRKVFLVLMAIAVISLMGCKETQDYHIIQFTHQLGESVTNPINDSLCIAPNAKQTLSSLRRISDRFYYMDFDTNLSLQTLVESKLRTNEADCAAQNQLWFNPAGYENGRNERAWSMLWRFPTARVV